MQQKKLADENLTRTVEIKKMQLENKKLLMKSNPKTKAKELDSILRQKKDILKNSENASRQAKIDLRNLERKVNKKYEVAKDQIKKMENEAQLLISEKNLQNEALKLETIQLKRSIKGATNEKKRADKLEKQKEKVMAKQKKAEKQMKKNKIKVLKKVRGKANKTVTKQFSLETDISNNDKKAAKIEKTIQNKIIKDRMTVKRKEQKALAQAKKIQNQVQTEQYKLHAKHNIASDLSEIETAAVGRLKNKRLKDDTFEGSKLQKEVKLKYNKH
jgi:hypothetical protein